MTKRRRVEILVGSDKSINQTCKEANVTDIIYYRWRRTHGKVRVHFTAWPSRLAKRVLENLSRFDAIRSRLQR